MDDNIEHIIKGLKIKYQVDFEGYHPSTIEQRIKDRLATLNLHDYPEYLDHINEHPEEWETLIDTLTIKFSAFFRQPLIFEFMGQRILPALFHEKEKNGDSTLRVWSAGCATGEEAYSLAILVQELLEEYRLDLDLFIFATDIDTGALKRAAQGVYSPKNLGDIKYRQVMKYFRIEGEDHFIKPEIKNRVHFSFYDLLDKFTNVPSESIYGGFDLVLCRNVLIYFQQVYQDRILAKLHRSLERGGYLVLGEAERPSAKFQQQLEPIIDYYPIYQKPKSRVDSLVFNYTTGRGSI